MRIEGGSGLALLHHLALLYLGLARGTDDHLDSSETDEIAERLRQWQPDKDPALIDHVVRDVTLSYQEDAEAHEVDEAVEALDRMLPEDLRADILHDLVRIAEADGEVLQAEEAYIRRVAEAWHLSYTGRAA